MSTHLRGIGMTSQRTRDRLIQRMRDEGISNENVLEVMRNTPRHIFVDEALASRAYEDTALPIGQGQTISQPYIVGRMTEALVAEGIPEKVLEVGTGSGYQTAVLAQLVPQVFTMERIGTLLNKACRRLTQLKLSNIRYQHADGNWGWAQYGPYDGIIVTAAPEAVPQELLQQLGEGGRLVIPSGKSGQQHLSVMTRHGDSFEQIQLDRVSFVPLLRGEG